MTTPDKPSALDRLRKFAAKDQSDDPENKAEAERARPQEQVSPEEYRARFANDLLPHNRAERAEVTRLSNPALLWRSKLVGQDENGAIYESEPIPEGHAKLKAAVEAWKATLSPPNPGHEAIAAEMLARRTPEERVAAQARTSKKVLGKRTTELDPISDFIQLARRWSLQDVKGTKGIKRLNDEEHFRMARYWESADQKVYAEAYRKYLIDLRAARGVAQDIAYFESLLKKTL